MFILSIQSGYWGTYSTPMRYRDTFFFSAKHEFLLLEFYDISALCIETKASLLMLEFYDISALCREDLPAGPV